MAKPSKIKTELDLLARRTNPLFIEHFDGWIVLGIRAGGESAVVMEAATNDALKQRLENEILAMAAEIVKQRNAHGQ